MSGEHAVIAAEDDAPDGHWGVVKGATRAQREAWRGQRGRRPPAGERVQPHWPRPARRDQADKSADAGNDNEGEEQHREPIAGCDLAVQVAELLDRVPRDTSSGSALDAPNVCDGARDDERHPAEHEQLQRPVGPEMRTRSIPLAALRPSRDRGEVPLAVATGPHERASGRPVAQ